MPLKVRDGLVVLKAVVTKIESLTGLVQQSYGNVTPETFFKFSIGEKSKNSIKLSGSSNTKKSLFK